MRNVRVRNRVGVGLLDFESIDDMPADFYNHIVMSKFTRIFSIAYIIFLVMLSVYIVLDGFVIPHEMTAVTSTEPSTVVSEIETVDPAEDSGISEEESEEISEEEVAAREVPEETQEDLEEESEEELPFTDGEVIQTENSYVDDSISVTVNTYRQYDTDIYVADIYVADLSHFLTAFAKDTYGRNITQKTSKLAAAKEAIIAINGDYYGKRESGYVAREGVLYRDTVYTDPTTGKPNEALVLYTDGTMEAVTEGEVEASELMENGAWDIWSFGPALIEDHEIAVSVDEEVGKAMASNPRTAIVYISPHHYLFIVSDGRTSASEGLSLYQLASFIKINFDAPFAFNLDGGGSSTMVFNGEFVNNPVATGSKTSERYVSDIVYIK